jgi:hypothetical protein
LEKEKIGRALTATQIEAFIGLLESVPKPTRPIEVVGADRESGRLGTTLKRALESAGFTVNPLAVDLLIGWTGPGILVRQKIVADPFGIKVRSALGAVGLDATVVEYDTEGIGRSIEIIIGYRPFEGE